MKLLDCRGAFRASQWREANPRPPAVSPVTWRPHSGKFLSGPESIPGYYGWRGFATRLL